MRIVFSSIPAFGHLYPMMPLAQACAAAGHDVLVTTGPPFLDRLPFRTAAGLPVNVTLDDVVQETIRRHPAAQGVELSIAMFADTTAGHAITTLLPVFESERPDLVVYEGMNVGAGIAAQLVGVPCAAFAIGLATVVPGMIERAALEHQSEVWLQRDLRPPNGGLAQLLIDPTPPSLQDAGVPEYPVSRIRSVPFNEGTAGVPTWLSEAPTRKRVYLTLGTVSFGAVEILHRALSEIAVLEVDLLVAVGPEGEPAALGEVPPNVHIERFVAQSTVLSMVDVVVHHGGTGTVLGALAFGLPQLVLPQGADQFFNGSLLERVGAARVLLNDNFAPGSITSAVSALLLGDAPERQTAGRLRDEIALMPSPDSVVDTLVGLV